MSAGMGGVDYGVYVYIAPNEFDLQWYVEGCHFITLSTMSNANVKCSVLSIHFACLLLLLLRLVSFSYNSAQFQSVMFAHQLYSCCTTLS